MGEPVICVCRPQLLLSLLNRYVISLASLCSSGVPQLDHYQASEKIWRAVLRVCASFVFTLARRNSPFGARSTAERDTGMEIVVWGRS